MIFANANVKDCHIYTYPFLPCSVCTGKIIQSGIKRVVSVKNKNPRWKEDFNVSRQMFKEAEICVIEYDE